MLSLENLNQRYREFRGFYRQVTGKEWRVVKVTELGSVEMAPVATYRPKKRNGVITWGWQRGPGRAEERIKATTTR